MKTRVCDFIANFMYETGIKDVFTVSGGGLLFLTDGLKCNEKINVICCHHEQAVAMSAVGYAKLNSIGCAYVTTGCGGTNAITGLLNAWQDSTPCIFISGQCKRKETVFNSKLNLRQIGVQEADIIPIVSNLTKYAVMVNDPLEIKYHLEKALYMAKEGRPGPVWLDIPMDVQSAIIETDELKGFETNEGGFIKVSNKDLEEVQKEFRNAKRPVILAGHGIRLASAIKEFENFISKHNIPFVFSRLGLDVMPTENHLCIGAIGNKGSRAGNFCIQNADFILVLGSRLSVSTTGQEYSLFAREAKVFVVDIDEIEHSKNTVKIDKFIHSDVKDFFNKFDLDKDINFKEWADKCFEWKSKFTMCPKEYYDSKDGINLYVFVEELSKQLKEDSVVVTDAGSAVYVVAQGIKTKYKTQRYVTSGGQAEMGFSLPAAIGCAVAKKGETIAITGDGSLQMNIQELQTLVYNKLPVKLFIWNNDGYLSIRASQNNLFDKRTIGTDNTNGVSFPNLEKISYAYGIKYLKIDNVDNLPDKIKEALSYNEPVICEVMCIRDQPVVTVKSIKLPDGRMASKPLEDMYPFMDRKEFYSNMIVKPINE